MDKSDLQILVPSKWDSFILLSVTILFIVLFNPKQVVGSLLGDDVANDLNNQSLPEVRHFFEDILSFLSANTITFVFWIMIGVFIIATIESIFWILHQYAKDTPHKGLVNAEDPEKSKRTIMLHIIIRSTAIAFLVVWIIVLFGLIFPEVSKLFVDGLKTPTDVYKAVLAPLALSFYLHLGSILIRLIALRKHILSY